MANRLKINKKAVIALLNSGEAKADLASRAEAIAAAAGEGFDHVPGHGRTRARHYVFPANSKAWYKQRKFHILEKALDAGRK